MIIFSMKFYFCLSISIVNLCFIFNIMITRIQDTFYNLNRLAAFWLLGALLSISVTAVFSTIRINWSSSSTSETTSLWVSLGNRQTQLLLVLHQFAYQQLEKLVPLLVNHFLEHYHDYFQHEILALSAYVYLVYLSLTFWQISFRRLFLATFPRFLFTK